MCTFTERAHGESCLIRVLGFVILGFVRFIVFIIDSRSVDSTLYGDSKNDDYWP